MIHYCNDRNAVGFVKRYYDDCVRLGKMANVPPLFILGLAASETGYGKPDSFARVNNYFSMETKSDTPNIKYAEGYVIAAGTVNDKHPTKIAKFPSFYVCGLSFIDRYGTAIRGASTPQQFVEALISSDFNSADKKTHGNPKFVSDVLGTITAVTARIACPG